MIDFSSDFFDKPMSEEEFNESKTLLQNYRSKFDFLASLVEADVFGFYKVSDADKWLIRDSLNEFDNAASFLPPFLKKENVMKYLNVGEQLAYHEDQLLEQYYLTLRNRLLAYGKAYRDISVLYEVAKSAVRQGNKEAIPVVNRLKEYHKKRADAIKAAKKAKQEADDAAKAAKAALDEALKAAKS